jgi:hypothetical protein
MPIPDSGPEDFQIVSRGGIGPAFTVGFAVCWRDF